MATQTRLLPNVAKSMSTTNAKEMPKIPVVSHFITDEDMEILQGQRLRPMNLDNVVKLLTDRHSAMLYDRHIHALKKLYNHYPNGFVMKDLVTVFKILNVCADRVVDQPLYIEPIGQLLQLTSVPFLKERSSDEVTYEQIAVESICQLGYLMRVPSKEVRLHICNAIKNFYCEDQPQSTESVQKHKVNTLEFNRKVIQKSDIAETLVKSLALVETESENVMAVIDVLQELSRESELNCNKMLQAGGANHVCSHLMDHDPSELLLFKSTELLWNLLEFGNGEDLATQLSNRVCISQLRDAFLEKLTQGLGHAHKQLRNDLLVLTCLVAKTAPDAPFVETGYVKQLVLLATFQEVKSHHALVKHLKLLRNPEDFEMKKMLVTVLVTLSADPAVLPILSEGRLLLALFSFVRANPQMPSGPVQTTREWTRAEFEELQLHAMSALCTLAPRMQDDYMMCQGGTRLLLLLEWCVSAEKFGGDGNCFYGAGGRGNKSSQMRHCVRLIRSVVGTENDTILQDLVDQGAIGQIINILRWILSLEPQRESKLFIETQADMLFILAVLCEKDVHKKELFGNAGVEMVIEYLKTDRELLSSGLGYTQLLLTAVECVWCSVVGCYTTEDYFLEKGGLFLLVDLLENCPARMHNLLLGCILDLLDNSKCPSHLTSWRGHDDVTVSHVLCQMWRDEERGMGVARCANGTIADPNYPLMGILQKNQGVTPLPSMWPSQAIVDVSENLRAKIYAVFCKIGFGEQPGLVNEDHITLRLIQHYLDLKIAEVWAEVVAELELEGVTPVTSDREALEIIGEGMRARVEDVLTLQTGLADSHRQNNLVQEQEHYAKIRDTHRQKERAIEHMQEFIARTSFYPILKAAKQRQDIAIDASRLQTNYRSLENFHDTEIKNLNTTVFVGRKLQVDSSAFASMVKELSGPPVVATGAGKHKKIMFS